jgi:hypothetical protein
MSQPSSGEKSAAASRALSTSARLAERARECMSASSGASGSSEGLSGASRGRTGTNSVALLRQLVSTTPVFLSNVSVRSMLTTRFAL